MKKRMIQAVLFVVILALGLIVFVMFSHLRPVLPEGLDWIGRAGLVAVLLTASLLARKSKRFERYWPVFYAFFIASLAMAIDFFCLASHRRYVYQ